MSKGLTLLHYWEELSDKQRRLIWDVLRANSSKRKNLPMGLLPFVPVKEIKLLLMRNPMSPWTDYLFDVAYEASGSLWALDTDKQYKKSVASDIKDYAEILQVLTKDPERKTQLAILLELWKEKHEVQL